MAYTLQASGVLEVVVRPFPDVASRLHAVSTDGGRDPTWSRDGRELFYRNGDAQMGVAVETAPTFRAAPPEELFRRTYYATEYGRQWDVSADGTFLFITSTERFADEGSRRIVVVQNWFTELERLVPTN